MSTLGRHTDQEIFHLFKEGNREAYNEIYNRYWEKLFNYAFHRTHSKDAAFEFVQEIFVSLWSRKETIEIQSSLSGYLFASVRFQMFNYVKQSKLKEQYMKDYVLSLNTSANYVEESVLLEDLIKSVQAGIDQLPPQCREITRLSLLENWSIEKIAQKLNISNRTVENQLSIGRQRLKESLTEYTLLLFLLNRLL